MAQVAERVTIAWFADETELARQIRVLLAPNGDGFLGRMEYIDESGRTVMRSLHAPDCEQAMAGIALVTAMAIESQAAQPTAADAKSEGTPQAEQTTLLDSNPEGNPQTAQPIQGNGESGSTSQQNAHSPSSLQASPVRSPPMVPSASKAKATGTAHATANLPAVTQELGVLAGAAYGVGPGVALGGGAFWGIGRRPFPLLRVGAHWYEYRKDSTATATITSRFRIISVVPQLCGLQPMPGLPELSGGICAGVELGQYLAEGKTSDPTQFTTQSHRLFWASAQLSVPLRLAGSSVFVEFQPVVRFPLLVGSFELRNTDQPVYEIPRIALGLNLAIGFTFR